MSAPHAQHRRELLELAQAALASIESWRAQPGRRFSCRTLGGQMEITVYSLVLAAKATPAQGKFGLQTPETRKFQTATKTVAALLG